MKVLCGPDVLTDELEILVALAESIRFDRDAWKNAACRLAEAYTAAAGIRNLNDGFDLPSIEFLLQEIGGQPVTRIPLATDRRPVH
jgi:hypothetical protein